jgi:hypothetical protein
LGGPVRRRPFDGHRQICPETHIDDEFPDKLIVGRVCGQTEGLFIAHRRLRTSLVTVAMNVSFVALPLRSGQSAIGLCPPIGECPVLSHRRLNRKDRFPPSAVIASEVEAITHEFWKLVGGEMKKRIAGAAFFDASIS